MHEYARARAPCPFAHSLSLSASLVAATICRVTRFCARLLLWSGEGGPVPLKVLHRARGQRSSCKICSVQMSKYATHKHRNYARFVGPMCAVCVCVCVPNRWEHAPARIEDDMDRRTINIDGGGAGAAVRACVRPRARERVFVLYGWYDSSPRTG